MFYPCRPIGIFSPVQSPFTFICLPGFCNLSARVFARLLKGNLWTSNENVDCSVECKQAISPDISCRSVLGFGYFSCPVDQLRDL